MEFEIEENTIKPVKIQQWFYIIFVKALLDMQVQ